MIVITKGVNILTLGERIKKVRRVLGLTQQVFSDRIGSKRNTVATYEMGRTEPSAAVISLICREFNVSETWLRTGEGDMFDQQEESVIDRLCAELHASELDTEIIRAYFRIDPRIREPFMRHLIQAVQDQSVAPAPDIDKDSSVPTFAGYEAEARAEAEEYYREILEEKRRAAGGSASSASSGTRLA